LCKKNIPISWISPCNFSFINLGIPGIVITKDLTDIDKEKWLALGINKFLKRPYHIYNLHNLIKDKIGAANENELQANCC
jgi:hypothetical protein